MLDPQPGQYPTDDQSVALHRNGRIDQLEKRGRVFVADGISPAKQRSIRQAEPRAFVLENGMKAP